MIEPFEVDGNLYFYKNIRFLNNEHQLLEQNVLDKVAEEYFSKRYDVNKLDEQELKDLISEIKETGAYRYCAKVITLGLDRFGDITDFLQYYVLALISCYRLLKEPEQAIDVALKYADIFPLITTKISYNNTLAAAYCDIHDYDSARDCIEKAISKVPKGQAYQHETLKVLERIKRESGMED